MKLCSLRSLGAVASLLLASSGIVSTVKLKATSTYRTSSFIQPDCPTPRFLETVSAVVKPDCAEADTTPCTAQNVLITGCIFDLKTCTLDVKKKTWCVTDSSFEADFATAFGSAPLILAFGGFYRVSGDAPYIIHATYTGDTACASDKLTALTAYKAWGCSTDDDGCFEVMAGAGGLDTTISRFNILGCYSPDSVTTLTSTDFACKAVGANSEKFFKKNWPTALDVAGVYAGCDKGASKLVFTAATADTCTVTSKTCAAHSSQDCTTSTEYGWYASDAIDGQFVMMERYTAVTAGCPADERVDITALAADGDCYKDGSKSFKVLSSSGGASVISFADAACVTIDGAAIDVTAEQLYGNTCVDDEYKFFFNGPLPHVLSVAVLYGATDCSGAPSKLTFTRVASSSTCSAMPWTCGASSTAGDCTTRSAYLNYAASAFGKVPHLIKKMYSGANCSSEGEIIAYAADGECHADGTGSFKVVPGTGGFGATITTYPAPGCARASTPVIVASTDLIGHRCVGNTAEYYTGKTWPVAWTSVAVHDVAACEFAPVKLELTTATCTKPASACETKTVGESTAAETVYLAKSCIVTSDHIPEIGEAFGMTPFVIQEKYTNAFCASLSSVTVYAADDTCHTGAGAASSFKVTLKTDGTAEIKTFNSTDCRANGASPVVVSPDALANNLCVGGTISSKFYVGGQPGKLAAVTSYTDAACTKPVQVLFTSTVTCAAPGTPCTALASTGLYVKNACTNDRTAFLGGVFGDRPRVVAEVFGDGKRGAKCGILQGMVAYVADAQCFRTLDAGGKSVSVTVDAGGATVSMFDGLGCSGAQTAIVVTEDALAAHTCVEDSNMKFYFGGTAPTTTATTPAATTAASTGSGTSGAASFPHGSMLGLLATTGALAGWFVATMA